MAQILLSPDIFLDSALKWLSSNCDAIVFGSTGTTSYTGNTTGAASSGVNIAFSSDATEAGAFAATPKLGETDFLIEASARAAGGRKVTTTELSAMPCWVSTNMSTVNLISAASGTLLAVTKLKTIRAVTTADTVTCPAFAIEFADPTTDSEI